MALEQSLFAVAIFLLIPHWLDLFISNLLMPAPRFLSIFRQPLRRTVYAEDASMRSATLPWIATPIDERDGNPPHLYRRSDATPIELFFDLFFVANLSTFTATHEINNMDALGAYIGFLGVIWFTWLQVTLFDIRFGRDSIFERISKAIQLGAMVGFASAGTRFSARIHDENVWAFQSLCLILAGSRMLLATQYTVNNIVFIRPRMKPAIKGVSITATILWSASLFYLAMYFTSQSIGFPSRVWTIWFFVFGIEMWMVMTVSCLFPEIGFQDTHLNVRMGLLTLIIIGEGVIAITRIVNKTVRPGGWTKWSFVHILGVTTNVYLLWQSYFDVSPRHRLGVFTQQVWAQLHFPFHVALILLLEGSQILALTLDVTLKLMYLGETIMFICEDPRPSADKAVQLIRSTIADMEIPFSRGATQEWAAISSLLEDIAEQPLCPETGTQHFLQMEDLVGDLMGNVTAALFSSMGITPTVKGDISLLDPDQLLQMYMKVLAFVYKYFFSVASLSMCLLAIFLALARRHERQLYLGLSIGIRFVLAIVLASLVSFASHFPLAYAFMTSPIILYAVTLTLLTVLLVDRLLDCLASRQDAAGRRKRESDIELKRLASAPGMVAVDSLSSPGTVTRRRGQSRVGSASV